MPIGVHKCLQTQKKNAWKEKNIRMNDKSDAHMITCMQKIMNGKVDVPTMGR